MHCNPPDAVPPPPEDVPPPEQIVPGPRTGEQRPQLAEHVEGGHGDFIYGFGADDDDRG